MCWYWLKISLWHMKWSVNLLLLPHHAQRKTVYNFVYITSWTPFTADLFTMRQNTSLLSISHANMCLYACVYVPVDICMYHMYSQTEAHIITFLKKMHLIVKLFLTQHEVPQNRHLVLTQHYSTSSKYFVVNHRKLRLPSHSNMLLEQDYDTI